MYLTNNLEYIGMTSYLILFPPQTNFPHGLVEQEINWHDLMHSPHTNTWTIGSSSRNILSAGTYWP